MQLTDRQKILGTLVVLALLVLCWQLGSLQSDVVSQHHLPTAKSKTLAAGGASKQLDQPALSWPPSPKLTAMSPWQQQYVALADRYRMVHMQRVLAEEEAAVAQARAKIQSVAGDAPTTDWSTLATVNHTQGQLLYLDDQDGQWTALLRWEGRELMVRGGQSLPGGVAVVSVDAQGVDLAKQNKRWHVGFSQA